MKLNPNIVILVLGLLLALLLLDKFKCGNGAGNSQGKSDTLVTITIDSTAPHKPEPTQTTTATYVPVERNTIHYLQPNSRVITDTVGLAQLRELYKEEIQKAKELYALCAAEHRYDSTYAFDEGKVRMKATVQGNRLNNFQLFPEFQTKVITNTPPPRNSVWVGVGAYYREQDLGAAASVLFQSKRGWGIEARAGIDQHKVPLYGIDYKRRLIK